ncbi:MAG: LD-carboxypeptidase [Chloroflexota bacterium]
MSLIASSRIKPALKPALKPFALHPGDTIGIVAPGEYPRNNSELFNARTLLEKAGFRVKIGEHVGKQNGYFAGSDAQRTADFNGMLSNPDVRAILTWGSIWGATRLLPLIDYDAVQRDPKLIIGCGNTTSLLNALHQRTGLVTLHGATLGTFYRSPYSYDAFIRALTSTEALGSVGQPRQSSGIEVEYPPLMAYVSGKANGTLVGGSLSALALSLGTPDEIEMDGRIVLLEARDIKPELISRYFTVLLNSGKLTSAAGIVVAECVNCVSNDTYNTFSFEGVLEDRLLSIGVPSLYGLRLGQGRDGASVPLGVSATLDTAARTLALDEAAFT